VPVDGHNIAGMRRAISLAVPVVGAVGVGVAIAAHAPLVAAVALVPVLLTVVVRPERATLVFVVAFYMNLPVVAANAAGISTSSAAAFAVLLGVPVLLALLVGRQALVVTPALALMVAWLVVLVLASVASGGARGTGAAAIRGFLTEGLLLYVLVVNAVRSPAMMRAVIWGLLSAGAVMGTISIWQEVTHGYHHTLFGMAQVTSDAFKVGETLNGKVLRPRLSGPIGDSNRYAQILLLLVPLGVSRMRAEPDVRLRWLAAGLTGLILCGMVLTFSRGAAVALVLVVVAMTVTGMVALRHVAVAGVLAVALVLVLAPAYVSRIQSLGAADTAAAANTQADGAIRGRATENLAAFATFRDHPFLGVGPGEFFRRYSQQEANKLDIRFLAKNRRAHNMYLEIAADTGIVGLMTLLSIVAVTVLQLWRITQFWATQGRDDLVALGQAFLLAVIAYMASAVFLQLSYQRYFWFLLALANGTVWMLRREAARARLAATPRPGARLPIAAPALHVADAPLPERPTATI
jgi:putative inorganic carbon (hco3(-)) transporter